ncbi:MAG: putative b-glycosidase, Glycoside Hydrolase Family 1, partial [Polaromonas sp.]|nr:putative b-glycosidase, Glycoside Hydrolase Family 1 [Polaromonas sp.]
VVRTSAFFGPWDAYNFAYGVLRDLALGRPTALSADVTVSPTYVPDLVHAVLDLLIDGGTGIWHLASQGQVSWHGFAKLLAQAAGFDPEAIGVAPAAGAPAVTALASERGAVMPTLEHGIHRYLHDSQDSWRAAVGQRPAS